MLKPGIGVAVFGTLSKMMEEAIQEETNPEDREYMQKRKDDFDRAKETFAYGDELEKKALAPKSPAFKGELDKKRREEVINAYSLLAGTKEQIWDRIPDKYKRIEVAKAILNVPQHGDAGIEARKILRKFMPDYMYSEEVGAQLVKFIKLSPRHEDSRNLIISTLDKIFPDCGSSIDTEKISIIKAMVNKGKALSEVTPGLEKIIEGTEYDFDISKDIPAVPAPGKMKVPTTPPITDPALAIHIIRRY